MWRNPDGSGPVEPLATPGGHPSSWFPDGTDGSAVAFTLNRDIWLLTRGGKTDPLPLVASPSWEGQAEFSPDGRWLAHNVGIPAIATGTEVGQIEVYVQPYPALNRRERVSSEGGFSPTWRHDGRELFYLQDASADGQLKVRVMAVPITTVPTFSAGTPRVLFEGPFRTDGPFRGYDVTPDGQRFLMVREVSQSPARVSHMVLVQNWTEELKRLVPTR